MASSIIGGLKVWLGIESAELEKGATSAERRMNSLEKRFGKIGDRMASIGGKMSIALTAPLVAFGVTSFKAASDAVELQSAFDQTFGAMSARMTRWAEETGDAMGRSTQELQQAASTFGIFFNQAAPTKQAAADLSKQFSVLAQDLSSFYNTDPSVALEKLRSGLSGESEPLRDFGVFLNEAAVKAKAFEMGLGGVGRELTEQEKIMARAAVIMEQTKNAQGDVARTADGTANRMRAAKAAFEELQVTVGTKLLPVLTPLIDKLAAALEWFSGLPEPVQNTVLVVAALSAALGPVLIAFGNLLPLLIKLGPALGLVGKGLLFIAANPVILALAAVIAGIYFAWQNWDKIEPILRRLYNGVKTWLMDKLGTAMDWVRKKIEMVEASFAWLYDKVVGNSWVPDMVDRIAEETARLDEVMVQPAVEATVRVSKTFKEMADETMGAVSRLGQSIKDGGFLGILEAVIGLGMQLGSIGVFGSKIASNINRSIPGYAGGTNFHPGGLAVVGERGPELVDMPRGSRVYPNGRGPGGGNTVIINANDAVLAATVRQWVAEGMAAAADAGGDIGVSRMNYRSTRRVA